MRRHARFLFSVGLTAVLLAGCVTPPGPPPDRLEQVATATATDLSNRQAGFTAELWADQPPPRLSDPLILKLRISADAYLSLYAIHTSGQTSRLLDNQPVRGARIFTFPGPVSPVDFVLTPPPGTETYLLVATQQPLRWLAPADIRRPGTVTTLNLTGQELQQRLRAVLARQNPYSWNSATLNLTVRP